MIRPGERVFIDSGAWIALVEMQDPLHARATTCWRVLDEAGARLFTSVPVVVETFTFLDRRGSRQLALKWRNGIETVHRFQILDCASSDLSRAWAYFDRREFHKLSLVDATSFTLMRKHDLRTAFAFDTHFALAGFRCVG